jgi:hypothetical protein
MTLRREEFEQEETEGTEGLARRASALDTVFLGC